MCRCADLSFQTAARILAASGALSLVVMKDISQNFPTKARYVLRFWYIPLLHIVPCCFHVCTEHDVTKM